jgi:hypothetical protein
MLTSLRASVRPTECTYKKKEVNRPFTGTPKSFLNLLRASLPWATDVSCRRVRWCGFCAPAPGQVNHFGVRVPCKDPSARLNFRRLEKRSQALQACNLTRNIQADGAPMVHRTPEARLRGFCFPLPSDTGVMPQKTHLGSAKAPPLASSCRPSSRAVACSYFLGRFNVAHAPIGDSRGRRGP